MQFSFVVVGVSEAVRSHFTHNDCCLYYTTSVTLYTTRMGVTSPSSLTSKGARVVRATLSEKSAMRVWFAQKLTLLTNYRDSLETLEML